MRIKTSPANYCFVSVVNTNHSATLLKWRPMFNQTWFRNITHCPWICELSIIKIKGLAAISLLWRSSDNLRTTRGSPHKKGFRNRAYAVAFKNKSSHYLLHKILFPRVPNLIWEFTIHNLNRHERIRILERKVNMQTSSADVLQRTSNLTISVMFGKKKIIH